jgi:hypothetical protein
MNNPFLSCSNILLGFPCGTRKATIKAVLITINLRILQLNAIAVTIFLAVINACFVLDSEGFARLILFIPTII